MAQGIEGPAEPDDEYHDPADAPQATDDVKVPGDTQPKPDEPEED